MVKIVQSNGTDDDPAGMDAMRAIVQRRLAAAQVPEDTAFDTGDALDYVCRMSGGHVRNLLILIRTGLYCCRRTAAHTSRC